MRLLGVKLVYDLCSLKPAGAFARAGKAFSASPCHGALWVGWGSGWLLSGAAMGTSGVPLESLGDQGWGLPCCSSAPAVSLSLQPCHQGLPCHVIELLGVNWGHLGCGLTWASPGVCYAAANCMRRCLGRRAVPSLD